MAITKYGQIGLDDPELAALRTTLLVGRLFEARGRDALKTAEASRSTCIRPCDVVKIGNVERAIERLQKTSHTLLSNV